MNVPDVLGLPLRERSAALSTGRIGEREFLGTANEWMWAADTAVRASTELREAIDASVRVGVKDIVDVAGFATRWGLRRYRHHPASSATALDGVPRRMINAKLVTPELSIGMEHGCENPLFPHIDPGGSSTGCAAAVAAHICDLTLGTDTVASVRLPAQACGVVGLRTTWRPTTMQGIRPLAPSLDATGWMTRTVDDLAFAWTGADGTLSLGAGDVGIADRLRIGLAVDVLDDTLHPEIIALVNRVADALAEDCRPVTPIQLGTLFSERVIAYELCAREVWDTWRRIGPTTEEPLSDSTSSVLRSGAAVSDLRYRKLQSLRHAYRIRFAALLSDVDVLLFSSARVPPRPRDGTSPLSTIPGPDETYRHSYSAMAALAGLPALTFPVGVSVDGAAPLSLQVLGQPWSEATLIAAAASITALISDSRPEAVLR